jgi:hypothetical protein
MGRDEHIPFASVGLADMFSSLTSVLVNARNPWGRAKDVIESSVIEPLVEEGKCRGKGFLPFHDFPRFLLANLNVNFFCRKSAYRSIINPDWDFQKMGIGGLDNEFSGIFRRAFASRVFPPEFIEQLGTALRAVQMRKLSSYPSST